MDVKIIKTCFLDNALRYPEDIYPLREGMKFNPKIMAYLGVDVPEPPPVLSLIHI